MLYKLKPYAMQTTASPSGIATGTGLLTILQWKLLVPAEITEWGISFDGFAAAQPGTVELIETDVAATVTAIANSGIDKIDAAALLFNSGDPTTNLISVGVAATGYLSTGEGTITAVREYDQTQYIAPTTQFVKQFPLGERPFVQAGKFGRVRVHFPATVNCIPYVVLKF